jgi:VWFA-related protein
MRGVGVWLGVALVAAGAWAQDSVPVAGREITTLQVQARLVELDVVVTGKDGAPVTGLTAADFRLVDDDAPQVLTGFAEHGPMGTMAPGMATEVKLPANVFTNRPANLRADAATVILIDAVNSPPTWRAMLRKEIVSYLRTAPPNTPMAIFQWDTSLRMIHGVSTDADALIRSIQDDRATTLLDGPMWHKPGKGAFGGSEVLAQIAKYLSGFPGRKNLIWFSGASNLHKVFYSAFPEKETVAQERPGNLAEVLTLNRTAVYPVRARELNGRAGSWPVGALVSRGRYAMMWDGWGGGVPPDFSSYSKVANDTGGRAYVLADTPKNTIAQIVEDGSHYYTVSYTPAFVGQSVFGRHLLKVEVDRPGVRLQYRDSYRLLHGREQTAKEVLAAQVVSGGAAAPAPAAAGTSLDASMDFGEIDGTEIVFAAAVKPGSAVLKDDGADHDGNFLDAKLRRKGYRTYDVRFSPDVRTLSLQLESDGYYRGNLDCASAVYDERRALVNGLVMHVPLEFTEEQYEQALRTGFATVQKVEIPAKGHYFLRVGVKDVDGALVGTLQVPVDEIKGP